MKIYCAHPISGLTFDEVELYYTNIKTSLESVGFEVFHPMTGKSYLRTYTLERFKPADYKQPIASNHAIFERDCWMVKRCDVFYLDLSGSESISIGCIMELCIASYLGKHTIVVMDEKNVHRHAFVMEAADIVFDEIEAALEYLGKLILQRI